MVKFLILVFVATAFSVIFPSFDRATKQAQVIYIPEIHTSKEDHEFQLKVIRDLYQSGQEFVIAMEMFQQPFQEFLDQYIQGKISEEEMIEKTEYKKRWGYDPMLYAPIWRFAKEKGIRVYAINIPTELIKKIKAHGIEKIEHPILPNPILDHTEKEKARLRTFLELHPNSNEKNFFDVQNAWDNAMALAIVKLLKEHKKVVVLIGKEHAPNLEEGVPRRVKELSPNTKQVILLNNQPAQD